MNNGKILKKENDERKKFPTFEKLLEKAKKQGRVDGPFECPVCGMRFNSKEEADSCCCSSIDI